MRVLSPERTLALIEFYESQGFQAIFDVLENITLDSEDDLIGQPPGDSEQIIALHATAHSQRAMLTKAANQIDLLVGESRGGNKKDMMARRKLSD